ncbi:MAG: BrnT family toxin [Terriglobia bacterium]
MYTYSWDEGKNGRNIALHGIAFEDAKRIFEGPTVERVDDRFDYGEIRVYAIGLVNGLEITVVYSDRGDGERRIISAWRAEPHERRAYWRNTER